MDWTLLRCMAMLDLEEVEIDRVTGHSEVYFCRTRHGFTLENDNDSAVYDPRQLGWRDMRGRRYDDERAHLAVPRDRLVDAVFEDQVQATWRLGAR